MRIKIRNWEKYNPKRDQKTYTWLRLDNDIFSGRDFFEYDAQEMSIVVSVLCEASKDNSGELEITMKYLKMISRCDEEKINATLKKLTKDKFLIISYDTGATPDDTGTTPTYERTNDTNDTNEPPKILPEKITPDLVMKIFNETCAGQGKIERYSADWLSGNALTDYINRVAMPRYQIVDEWHELFNRVASNKFLCGEEKKLFVATLPWILKPDNFDVIMGSGYPCTRKEKKSIVSQPECPDDGYSAEREIEKMKQSGVKFGNIKLEINS